MALESYPFLPFSNNSPELTSPADFLTGELCEFSTAEFISKNYFHYDPSTAISFCNGNEVLDILGSETDTHSPVYCSKFSDQFEIPAMEAVSLDSCISSNDLGQFMPELSLPHFPVLNFNSVTGVCNSGDGIRHQVTEFRRKSDAFVSDYRRVSNSGDLQATCCDSLPMIEDCGLRVSRYSIEEKRERIRRYLKKRNKRNFNKTIKYACRKTLADSRPRIHGRFTKNEELVDDVAMKRMRGQVQDQVQEEDRAKEREEWLQQAVAALMYWPISAES